MFLCLFLFYPLEIRCLHKVSPPHSRLQAGRIMAQRARIVQPWLGTRPRLRSSCREAAQFNKPDAANPSNASRLHSGPRWRGVADPKRSATSHAMTASQDLFVSEQHPVSRRWAVIEDDGRAAWLYLTEPDTRKPVADCWLYNRVPTPPHFDSVRDEPPVVPQTHAGMGATSQPP